MPSFRAVARLGPLLVVALPLLSAPPPVAANGIGDVYVATADAIAEVHAASSQIVNSVDVTKQPTSLAFSPDGHTLFLANGTASLGTIDIESISAGKPVPVPSAATAIAFPRGSRLAVALPDSRTVASVDPGGDDPFSSRVLPGRADLLAADRRASLVLAAARGQGWFAIVDPVSGEVTHGTVAGNVTSIAVGRDGTTGYVGTQGPDEVVAIDLATTAAKWRRSLPESPVGVTMTDGGLVIASAKHLFEADPTGVRSWRANTGSATAITSSDDGSVVLVAEGALVEAVTIDGRQTRRIALGSHGKALAIAAMPRPSSLVGLGTGDASPQPVADPPATDTLPVANLLPKFSVIGWIGGAVSFVFVFFGIFVWLTRRRAHRRPAQ